MSHYHQLILCHVNQFCPGSTPNLPTSPPTPPRHCSQCPRSSGVGLSFVERPAARLGGNSSGPKLIQASEAGRVDGQTPLFLEGFRHGFQDQLPSLSVLHHCHACRTRTADCTAVRSWNPTPVTCLSLQSAKSCRSVRAGGMKVWLGRQARAESACTCYFIRRTYRGKCNPEVGPLEVRAQGRNSLCFPAVVRCLPKPLYRRTARRCWSRARKVLLKPHSALTWSIPATREPHRLHLMYSRPGLCWAAHESLPNRLQTTWCIPSRLPHSQPPNLR